MAITWTEEYTTVEGNQRVWVGEGEFDSTYPAGGEVVAASDFNFDLLKDIIISGIAVDEATDLGLGVYFDKTAGKIQLFEGGADGDPWDENATVDVSNYTFRVRAYGW